MLGAKRSGLISQFLAESLLLNFASLLIAFIAALLLTPWFNQFTGHIASGKLFSMSVYYWLVFLLIFFAGTLLSRLYPAFVLSGYNPVAVLKGIFKNAAGGLLLRKGLITLQFVTSITLIAGTIIVYQQVQFMRLQDLGFSMKQTIVLNGASSVKDSVYQSLYQPFKTDILHLPGVQR